MFGTQETKSIYQSFTNVLDATKQVVARCMHGSTPTDDARCALTSIGLRKGEETMRLKWILNFLQNVQV